MKNFFKAPELREENSKLFNKIQKRISRLHEADMNGVGGNMSNSKRPAFEDPSGMSGSRRLILVYDANVSPDDIRHTAIDFTKNGDFPAQQYQINGNTLILFYSDDVPIDNIKQDAISATSHGDFPALNAKILPEGVMKSWR